MPKSKTAAVREIISFGENDAFYWKKNKSMYISQVKQKDSTARAENYLPPSSSLSMSNVDNNSQQQQKKN